MQIHLSRLLIVLACWSAGIAAWMPLYQRGFSAVDWGWSIPLFLLSVTMFGVGFGMLAGCRFWLTLLVSFLVSIVVFSITVYAIHRMLEPLRYYRWFSVPGRSVPDRIGPQARQCSHHALRVMSSQA
jgi:hypothetical protein